MSTDSHQETFRNATLAPRLLNNATLAPRLLNNATLAEAGPANVALLRTPIAECDVVADSGGPRRNNATLVTEAFLR